MLLHVGHQLPLVGDGKHLNVLPFPLRGENDVNLMKFLKAVFCTIAQDHLQDHENIPDGLLAEACGQFPVHEALNILFPDVCPLSQFRNQMTLNEKAVGCVG